MFKTILLAVDMNDMPESGHVADAAVHMAECTGARLHIINVIPGSGMAMVGSYLGAEQANAIKHEAAAHAASPEAARPQRRGSASPRTR